MAQIPDFEAVGSAVPTPAYKRPLIDRSGEMVGAALEGAGRGLEQAGNEDFTKNVNLARAQASNVLLDHQIAVQNTTEDIRQKVASGELSWDQAPQAYQDAVGKFQTPAVQNLDPVGQENFNRGMTRNVQTGKLAVDGIARLGRKQAFADQFGDAIDKLGKLAGMPGADIEDINSKIDAFRPMALDAGIAPHDVDKAIQSFKDTNWLNQATQRAMESKDSLPALKQLRHDLVDSDGFYAGKLNTEKRDAVLGRVINNELVLQNRIEHEQDRREAKAMVAVNQMNEQIASGIPGTPASWDRWASLTKGTSMEGEFREAQQNETKVQEILRAPPAEQVKYVQDQESKLDQQGGTLRDRANVMRLRTAVNQNLSLMQNQPLLFAANRTGADVQPIDFAKGDPQEIGAAIQDRMSTINALRRQYGSQVGVQPLLPQETAQLKSSLDAADYKQRAAILTNLRDSFNNDDAYQAVMRRLAPGSPVTAIAGQMIGQQAPASTPAWYDRSLATHPHDVELVLHGEELLNPGAEGKDEKAGIEKGKGAVRGGMPMPKEPELQLAFGNAARGLFGDRPQEADARYSVFKAAYAGLLAEHGDMRGIGDPTLQKQALQIALGHPVDFNGSTVSVPRGMDPTRFTGLVREAVAEAAKATGAPKDWEDRMRGYQLVEVGGLGSGVYKLRGGNGFIPAPDGRGPFVIDLHNQFLPGTAGAAAAPKVKSSEPPDIENKIALGAAAAAQAPP